MSGQHGGIREGAGRKPGPSPKVKSIAVRITQQAADTIEDFCEKHDCTQSECVNRILESYTEKQAN